MLGVIFILLKKFYGAKIEKNENHGFKIAKISFKWTKSVF